STYSVCTVIAGLEAAAKLAEATSHPADASEWRRAAAGYRAQLDKLCVPDGAFSKGFLLSDDGTPEPDDTLDISSLYGPFMFAGLPLDDKRMQRTLHAVHDRLYNSSPIGGVIRYENDNYFLAKQQYQGNPWIVCTLWLAQYLLAVQRGQDAKDLLDWALARRMSSGVLSEQFDPEDGTALSVAPLVWSHAELVNTLLDLYKL
ncbi:MAG TPA: glycoside hydrolase family 15 protein, partial [Candidatus Saccharimonadales bacterium]|nr:glycoside hydrolase family 15 protein [Candidatus Saccharimonadales bacterium]